MNPVTKMATLTLSSTKAQMPKLGLGTWKIHKESCADTVYKAIELGYRLLDCACDYGNEVEVGRGLQKAIDAGIVKREDMFITSKLWCTFMDPEHVQEAFEKSLADLGCGYLDLYLIHFPIALKYVDPKVRYPPGWAFDDESGLVYSNATLQQTWEAMEKLVDTGLVKNIGVANYNCTLIREVLKYARIPPAVNQIELHPYLHHQPLVNMCQKNGIQLTAFQSLGGQSLVELGNDLAIETPNLLQHDTVSKIASKHGMSTAQVLLSWAMQRNIAVIPKSNNVDRLRENLNSTNYTLDGSDMSELAALDQNLHFNDPKDFADTPLWN